MPTDVQPMYDRVWDAIAEIDVKLDSLQDSGAATKRRVINQLVEDNKEIWEAGISGTVTNLRNLEGPALVGVVEGIISTLRSTFKEEMEKTLEGLVETAPKQEPLVTVEEAAELSKQRSGLYQQIKMLVQIAKQMDDVDLAMPKTRRGAHGKRGQRAMSKMIWAINGEELDPRPTYKELAIKLGFEGSGELTAYLKSKGVDTKNPADGKINVDIEREDQPVVTLEGYIPEEDDEEEDDEDDTVEDEE